MTYYCKECWEWQNSEYAADKHGRRYCNYSKRYEEPDQNIYGCKGFIYVERAILTKICNILGIPAELWFKAFDNVKDEYIVPMHMEWLTRYCCLGPQIAHAMDADTYKKVLAKHLMNGYILPAYKLWQEGNYEESAKIYCNMVYSLVRKYGLA